MTTSTFAKRTAELSKIWQDNRWLYLLAGVLIGILVTPAVERLNADFFALLGDLVPEAVGILITVTVIEGFNRTREYKRKRAELTDRTIREIRANHQHTISSAVHAAKPVVESYPKDG
ncbi:MAG: hypothetical protein AAF787_25115 [Chloroflexota bacterium]